MLDNNATREPFSRKINARNVGFSIRQALRDYFANDAADFLSLSFDGEKFNQEYEINFKELLLEICKNNENEAGFSDFKNYLNGENDKFKLAMSFDKAVFENYPSFDELRCHKLSFSNTVFKKGVRLRHIDVDEVLFEPRELGADATFFHREKANIDEGVLRGKDIGKIGKFKYRHQLEGGGTTFLIGMRFTEKAEFTDCVLDKVQFSSMDDDSMSKCFFANSIIENTRFYNCDFYFTQDAYFVLAKNGGKRYQAIIFPIIIISALGFAVYTWPLPYAVIPCLAIIALFGAALLMPVFDIIAMPLRLLGSNKANSHISIADDLQVMKIQNQNAQPDNYKAIREVYRQLKVNFEKQGDYKKAGDFYYSQRYCELINYGRYIHFLDDILLNLHYLVNGYGERWLRAFVWFALTITVFAFLTKPNEDFISTKSTPEYFLNAYIGESDNTSKIVFNKNKITGNTSNTELNHFMEVATTNYNDSNIEYIKDKNISIIMKQPKDANKTFYAFDNRFDFYYTSQFIPILKNNFEIRITHSLSKMIAPFVSEEKKWFQDRSERGYYLGFLESILLWIFFVAFLLAVKNRIRR